MATSRIDYSKVRTLGNPDASQVVYVYSVDGVPGRVKIGHTTQGDWRDRIAQQLNASTPGTISVEIVYRTNDSASMERILHRLLASRRCAGAREWFNTSPEWLIENVDALRLSHKDYVAAQEAVARERKQQQAQRDAEHAIRIEQARAQADAARAAAWREAKDARVSERKRLAQINIQSFESNACYTWLFWIWIGLATWNLVTYPSLFVLAVYAGVGCVAAGWIWGIVLRPAWIRKTRADPDAYPEQYSYLKSKGLL